ncbi:hypothetical protein GCM10022287_18390 [Gryllotalpicola koreensis]|uniref:Transcriptional regulator, AbiEi antitoxin, Type IV TA system n=2 Tax=Gryllotalpicola koreensis TaxID=993086 RepID=A0ABP8A041_9MICO
MNLPPPDLSRLIDARRTTSEQVDSAVFRRAAARGELDRLRRSIYREPLPSLSELKGKEFHAETRRRYLEQAISVGLTHSGRVIFAGETALAIHGFPLLGGVPSRVELLEPPASGRRRVSDTTVHFDEFREQDVQPWGEFFVTTPARTLADAAKWLPRAKAVSALDFALNADRAEPRQRAVQAEVLDALAASAAVRNRVAAQAAVDFANGASGSVGESVSRVLMDAFGFPVPQLQVRHAARPGGRRWYFTDFEWPEFGLIGEFDGLVKLRQAEFRNGRDAVQVVIDEKLREDFLRSGIRDFVRWDWSYLREPLRLRTLLVAHGLPASRGPRHLGRPW